MGPVIRGGWWRGTGGTGTAEDGEASSLCGGVHESGMELREGGLLGSRSRVWVGQE